MSNLKECPFEKCHKDCLEYVTNRTTQIGNIFKSFVICMDCGARGPTAYAGPTENVAEDLATYSWNTRNHQK